MKKALIFNPYLDTLGGGESYCLSIAEFLQNNGFDITFAWKNQEILKEIYKRFNLNIKDTITINSKTYDVLKEKNNLLKKYFYTKKYDLIFFVSDGSVPFLFGRKNWLLFQAPFTNIRGRSLLNQFKLKKINRIFCYSNFVKKIIDKEFNINADVIYPPISDYFFQIKPLKKENIILSVGRFDQIMNAKKQDFLVEVFKEMVDKGLNNWQLVLVGGLMKDNAFFHKLKEASSGYPIKILSNVDFQTLINYYKKSKIYWHAAGYGEDLSLHPKRAEHFGISIVEAVVLGAFPLVYKKGGPAEIIQDENFLWVTKQELMKKTNYLVNNSKPIEPRLRVLRNNFYKFSRNNFFKQMNKLMS